MKQKGLSRWLKFILIGVGICGLLVYFIVFPSYGQAIVDDYPEYANRYWPWLLFLWGSGIPCYAVLVIGWKVATKIGLDQSFSMENASILSKTEKLYARKFDIRIDEQIVKYVEEMRRL